MIMKLSDLVLNLFLNGDRDSRWSGSEQCKERSKSRKIATGYCFNGYSASRAIGIDACEEITQKYPDVKVVMLTSYAEDEMLFSAIRAGASGYLLKQISSEDLVRSLESVARGDALLDPLVTQRVFQEVRRAVKEEEASAFAILSQQEKHVDSCFGRKDKSGNSKVFILRRRNCSKLCQQYLIQIRHEQPSRSGCLCGRT